MDMCWWMYYNSQCKHIYNLSSLFLGKIIHLPYKCDVSTCNCSFAYDDIAVIHWEKCVGCMFLRESIYQNSSLALLDCFIQNRMVLEDDSVRNSARIYDAFWWLSYQISSSNKFQIRKTLFFNSMNKDRKYCISSRFYINKMSVRE